MMNKSRVARGQRIPSLLSSLLKRAFGDSGAEKPPKPSASSLSARRSSFTFEALEPRLLLSADLSLNPAGLMNIQGDASANTFVIEQTGASETGATLSVSLDGGPSQVFSGVKGLSVDAAEGNDSIRLLSAISIDATLDGGEGSDTLQQTFLLDSVWTIAEENTGDVNGQIFSGIENLVGAADNEDTFVFAQGASLSGGVEGGVGGYDTVVLEGVYAQAGHEVVGPQSGVVTLDGRSVRYAGMEPIDYVGAIGTLTFTGTSGADTLVLSDIADLALPGGVLTMQISGSGELTRFNNTVDEIVIKALGGSDTITVASLDSGFAGDLLIYGNSDGADASILDLLADSDTDTLAFTGSVPTQGGKITAVADSISVAANQSLNTRKVDSGGVSTGNSGNITLDARSIALESGSSLLAHVQSGSPYLAGDIMLKARAASIVRTANAPAPAASITATGATIQGDFVSLQASSAERFGVFGFKKDAAATVTLTDVTVDAGAVDIDAAADTTLLPALSATMTGNPLLTITAVASGADTITRDSGSWIVDGFTIGQSITLLGTANNDGAYIIKSVSADTIEVSDGDVLVDEVTTAAQPVSVGGESVMPDPETLVDLLTPFTGSAVVTLSTASAQLKVLGASSITARGQVALNSSAESRATPFGPGLAIPKAIAIAAAWAQSTATAETSIDGTTVVNAGSLSLGADTDNTVTANSLTMSRNTPVSLTFAGAKVDGVTKAFIGAGTVVNAGESVSLRRP